MSAQVPNLQEEIFWGGFVSIAKNMYTPGVTTPPKPADFPANWKLVKNITVEPVVTFIKQREFIGFLAQSLNNPLEFAAVFHGTISVLDFIDDVEFELIHFDLLNRTGKTEYGFTKLYESISFVDPANGSIMSLQAYLSNLTPRNPISITVAGHSLGAALGILHSVVLASKDTSVRVYGFAPPMVGDADFVNTYNSLVPKSRMIVNQPDIVPRLPGPCLGYEQVQQVYEINTGDFPSVKRNLVCFHALESYLYALKDGNGNLGSCHT